MTDSTANARTVAETALTMRQSMQPEHSNSQGNVHGGVILKLCDECGGMIATRYARRPCVTVTIDSVNFHRPVYVGQLLSVYGQITYVGRTSIEVELRVEAENLLTGEITHTNSAFFVYVALDEHRQPVEVPRLLLETDEERQRFADGRARQEARLKRKRQGK